MFRNVLAAALRNLMRNRLYAAISIGGLAIGMAAALLTALFVHDEVTFDRFIPGGDRVFVLFSHSRAPGRGEAHFGTTEGPVAAWLKLDFPQVVKAVRYTGGGPGVRTAKAEANDPIAWVDPGFFSVVRLPVLAGDPNAAIERPDGVVLTRAMARKYFGRDAPIGETLQFSRKTNMRVGAVIADLPGASNIQTQIFASGRAPTSALTQIDARPYRQGNYLANFRTFVLLRDPRDAVALNAAMPAFIGRHMAPPAVMANSPMFQGMRLALTPITAMHMQPDVTAEVHPGSLAAVYALSAVSILILVVAATNFVNLQTARGARRAVEVGIRKASGAAQHHLMLQFLGESLLYAVLAMALALALAEAALPGLEALVRRHIPFLYWRDPAMMALAAGLTVILGLAAGAYPAVVLSSFRPAAVLKDGLFQASGSKAVRQTLVIGQFVVLIGLLIGVIAVYAQTRFAMTAAIGLDKEQMLQIATTNCRGAFVDQVRALPGVARSTCSSGLALGLGDINTNARRADGQIMFLGVAPIDYGFFETYGVKPLAGRLPSRGAGGDGLPANAPQTQCFPASAVVNASAVRAFRFASPQKMVGATISVSCGPNGWRSVRVMGVVPDIAYNLTTGAVKPILYAVDPRQQQQLSLKLRPNQIPATLAAIDRAWARSAADRPIRRRFMDQYLQGVYADLISQGWLLGVLAGVAAFLAGLGLFGLAAFTTEQRTKEIGVRKAMGASTADILRLLLWSFTQPVVWANVIAWPLSWWLLERWLQGFSARIALSPWFFAVAGGAALIVSALTVCGHALRVARAIPAGALRYE
jgi:putative ABC transport system permease protein